MRRTHLSNYHPCAPVRCAAAAYQSSRSEEILTDCICSLRDRPGAPQRPGKVVGARLDERGTVANTDSVLSPQRRRSERKAALGPGCFRVLQSKRILTNTLALAPSNGVDVHAFEMSRALAARGHSIDVVAQRDGPLREQF